MSTNTNLKDVKLENNLLMYDNVFLLTFNIRYKTCTDDATTAVLLEQQHENMIPPVSMSPVSVLGDLFLPALVLVKQRRQHSHHCLIANCWWQNYISKFSMFFFYYLLFEKRTTSLRIINERF